MDIDIAGAGGSVTHVAGVGGNGQKFSRSGMKKTVPRRALRWRYNTAWCLFLFLNEIQASVK